MKEYFELKKPYKFDPTDLTAVIFFVCAVLGIMEIDATIPFAIGSAIGFATCFKARRINLVVLNGALFVLNIVNIFKLFL